MGKEFLYTLVIIATISSSFYFLSNIVVRSKNEIIKAIKSNVKKGEWDIKTKHKEQDPRCIQCDLFREKCPVTWCDSMGNVEHICDVKGIKFCSFFQKTKDI